MMGRGAHKLILFNTQFDPRGLLLVFHQKANVYRTTTCTIHTHFISHNREHVRRSGGFYISGYFCPLLLARWAAPDRWINNAVCGASLAARRPAPPGRHSAKQTSHQGIFITRIWKATLSSKVRKVSTKATISSSGIILKTDYFLL